jgi:hypothetical protein
MSKFQGAGRLIPIKLPNGKYGLLKWYPKAKPPRPAASGNAAPVDEEAEGREIMEQEFSEESAVK